MKRLLSFAICMVLMGSAFGQERFTIPERTPEQKHNRTLSQFWVVYAAGINFAKSQDISPYEYGKYIGNLFAPSWNEEDGFDGFVNGLIYNWENFKTDADGQMIVITISEGLVIVKYPEVAWKKYLPEDNPYASFQETLDCLNGIIEPIANHMGCTITQEVTEGSIVYTINKK